MLKAFKISILAFFSALVLAAPTVGFAEGSALLSVLPKELPRLIVSKWEDGNKSQVEQQWYRESHGLFENYFASTAQYMPLKSSSCQSFLELNQEFPLSKMVVNGYISEAQKQILQKLGQRLRYSQFRFFEHTQTHDADDLKDAEVKEGKIPAALMPLMVQGKIAKIDATIWSVSAQVTTSHVKRSHEKMPWQLDKDYAEIKLDREKFKLAWEIGRAAQSTAGNNDTMVKAAITAMLNDTLAYGEKLEDAYVFVHTLGAAQSRLFQMRKIPGTNESAFKVFHTGDAGKHDQVLVARLVDLLAILPPDTFSKQISGVIAAAKGQLNWKGAAEHLFAVRDAMRQDVDVVLPSLGDGRYPIVVRNTTPVIGWYSALVSRRYGLPDDLGFAITRYLSSIGWRDDRKQGSFLVDPDIVPTGKIAENKLIGISNLDDAFAAKNPDYAKLLLMSVYMLYAEQLQTTYPMQKPQLLEQTQFVLTGPINVGRQAMLIPGGQMLIYDYETYRLDFDPRKDNMITTRRFPQRQPGFVYDSSTIVKLIEENPALAKQARHGLRKSNWQLIHHLNEAIGF